MKKQQEWIRLPSLYRRFEFEQVIKPGMEFYFEELGEEFSSIPLFNIYYRPHHTPKEVTE